MSELLAIGVSHKTAAVELRERLALPAGQADELCAELVAEDAIDEAVALSTCNRSEIYLACSDPVVAESLVLSKLAQLAGIRPTELLEAIYSLRNCDAARHLYRVSAGLESMIVGENEVQGQVKKAYDSALKAELTGPLLNRLFRAAIETGKRVRHQTAIGVGSLSVASVAVELAKTTIGDLPSRRVVVLGAGETSEQTAQALTANGVGTVFVANRRRERALNLAEKFGGQAVSFDELPDELHQADIVLASTASPHPIVGAEELELVMRNRGYAPLLLIDIAVPRDIAAECAQIDGVTLYDIDDLQAVVDRNRSVRSAEVAQAEAVVEGELHRFANWLGTAEVLPTITELRARGDQIVNDLITENLNRWESASPDDLKRIEAMAHAVANRLLHEPTNRLKRTERERRHSAIQTLRDLFGLAETTAEVTEESQQEPLGKVHELHPKSRRKQQ